MTAFNADSRYHRTLLASNIRKFGNVKGMEKTKEDLKFADGVPTVDRYFSRIIKGIDNRNKYCKYCGELLSIRSNRQKYCNQNSEGLNCALQMKMNNIYNKRKIIHETQVSN